MSLPWLRNKPQGYKKSGLTSLGMPQKKPRNLAPLYTAMPDNARAGCGQDPHHLLQLRSPFGAAQAGRGGRLHFQQFPSPRMLTGQNHPSLPAAAPPAPRPPVQKPLGEETEASLLLAPVPATAKPGGTAAGSVLTGEGAGNTALSEGCSNKQEPVKSHPSRTLISV